MGESFLSRGHPSAKNQRLGCTFASRKELGVAESVVFRSQAGICMSLRSLTHPYDFCGLHKSLSLSEL